MNDETRKEAIDGLINYTMTKIEKDSKKQGNDLLIPNQYLLNVVIMKAALEYILIQKVVAELDDETLSKLFREFYYIVFERNLKEDRQKAEKQIEGIITMNITQYRTFHKLLQFGSKSKEFTDFVSQSIKPLDPSKI
jgi:hypothetical protein